MPMVKKELKEALQLAVKTLIFQEVRGLQLERTSTPHFLFDEMTRSIEEAKRQVTALLRLMATEERDVLIKKVIRQSVNEEIDRAIEARKNRCLRCIHVRYFDDEGSAHVNLPVRKGRAQVIGCEIVSTPSKIQCRRFLKSPTAASVEDYLMEMAFLYEFREMIDQIDEIWEDYLTR